MSSGYPNLALMLSATVAACGLSITGSVDSERLDAGSTNDATAFDASTVPPPNDGDGGSVEDAAAADAAEVMFNCNGTMVADCGGCTGRPIGCVYCATAGGPARVGRCGVYGYHCRAFAPSGYEMCPCTIASECPYASHVCHAGVDGQNCRTCGEPNTGGEACMGGGSCQATAACQ